MAKAGLHLTASCVQCGNEYRQARSDQLCCSYKCSQQKWRAAQPKAEAATRNCDHCKISFISIKPNKRFCSDECRATAELEKRRLERAETGPGKRWAAGKKFAPRRNCTVCGKEFYASPAQERRSKSGLLYCSQKCFGTTLIKDEKKRTCKKCRAIFTFVEGSGTRFCDSCVAAKPKPVVTSCEACKKTTPSGGKFCDRGCYTAFRVANKKERVLKVNAVCAACGNKFYAAPGHVKSGWGKYCSTKCKPLPKHGSAKGGTREDLGIYVRSSWEANYARYLKFLKAREQILDWEYEPKVFEFHAIKRGVRSYVPDFRVTELGGSIVWHEVKGYMDDKSKTKLNRMAKFYPEEKVIVIGSKEMREIKNKLAALIPLWESWENDKLGSMVRSGAAISTVIAALNGGN